ncbi:ABC transporter ATP-binding protein [Paradesulfitobacterium ferrireducens]|uniref:ABC transporter ATP-binding protein n=1 Tax=Paradesulfitobacterium ferrireducens TaxID=2816476 RepID=UPI001A8DDE9C|nr:ABC transporter ATP-binding protein [Paradesulfitobacterium ferrireducens]
MILSVKQLGFRYGISKVLEDVSFAVARGEFLAVLGNNGAGKSTLLKSLNRIIRPEKGKILLETADLFKLSRTEIARHLAYVSQRYESSRLTVFDAVLLGRKPYIQWEASAHDLSLVQEVLERLGLEPFALRYLDEMSGGELQKVIIARALAQEPDVLLLDEPTSNLDLKNQIEVLRAVKETAQERDLAVIAVMHDLNLALRFANRFLLLKDKKVLAVGGMEVMTEENIAKVYGVKVRLGQIENRPVVMPL